MKHTTLFTISCAMVLVGLAAARRFSMPGIMLLAIFFVILFVGFWLKQSLPVFVIGIGLVLGLWRGGVYMIRLSKYQALFQQRITLTALADNDAVYGKQSQLSFDVIQPAVIMPSKQVLVGRIKVDGLGASMVYRGDQVQIQGSLSPTKGASQAKISFAKITVIKRGTSPIDGFRRRFVASLESVLPEPEAPFGAGLLLGQRSTIPKDINDQLSATGLTHLVAVSGYNLTIIIVAVRRLLGGASKFQSTMTATGLVLLFVVTTGLSASIVRAALVSSLSLLAWYFGRQFKPLLLIIGTAAATAAWNPFYLWSDIGWYLSYLAFFGVLIITPLLAALVGRGRNPKLVGGLWSETVAAQVMTLPIIMYIFGRVSIIGLVANLLVVPLVPLAMLLTLIAGLAGMLSVPVGSWLAWPAKVLLTYIIDIVGVLSHFPHASIQRPIGLTDMIISYVGIIIMTVLLRQFLASRKPGNYDKVTE